MALKGAPTGSKIGGQVRAGSRAGRPAGQRGTTRQAIPLRGGNPKPTHLDALVNGKRAGGKLPGAD